MFKSIQTTDKYLIFCNLPLIRNDNFYSEESARNVLSWLEYIHFQLLKIFTLIDKNINMQISEMHIKYILGRCKDGIAIGFNRLFRFRWCCSKWMEQILLCSYCLQSSGFCNVLPKIFTQASNCSRNLFGLGKR